MSIGSALHVGANFRIDFRYNPKVVQAVKELPERRFDFNEKVWFVPSKYRDEVVRFCKKYNLTFGVKHVEQPQFNLAAPPLPELMIDIPLKRGLRPYQGPGVAYTIQKQRLIMGDDMGLGKSQPLTSKILTPNGWCLMRDVKIGQKVIGSDGKPCQITGIYPQGDRDVYEVVFSDGSKTRCCKEHLWSVITPTQKLRKSKYKVMELQDIISEGLTQKSGNSKFYIPMVLPVEFEKQYLPIHPYLLGALLGDGSLTQRSPRFTTNDSFIYDKVSSLLPSDVKLRKVDSINFEIVKRQGKKTAPNPLKSMLIELGVYYHKSNERYIPELYLHSCVEDRVKLLQGLLDTDGWVNKGKRGNAIQYCTASIQLAKGVVELVQSLGGVTSVKFKENSCKGAWILTISLPNYIMPFSLPRKSELVTLRIKYFPTRAIKSIEYIGKSVCQCIAVDAPDNLYVTDDYIVTHNTMQAIAAIEGLHVTAKEVYPCLIICPSAVKENWKREIEKTVHKKAIIMADSVKNTFTEFYRTGLAQFFIVNYESLKKYFVDHIDDPGKDKNGRKKPLRIYHIHFKEKYLNFFKSVIVDESHRVKALQTQATKFTKGVCTGKETILLLTGTPVINKPKDLISQLGILDRLPDFGGYKAFEERYCSGPNEASNLKELNYRLNVSCFYRRNKTDPEVKKYLPDKLRQVVLCDLNEAARREYNHALADLESYMKQYKDASDDQIKKSMKGEVMVRIGILKNISARGKLKDAFDFIKDVIDGGQKIVVFCNLTDIVHAVQAKFPRSVRLTGAENAVQKQASVDAFKNNLNVDLIAINLKAGGVGVDGLQDAATQTCFIEFGWHAAIMDQAEDRLYRMGQHSNVMCTYFLGRATIDEWNYKLIQTKREIANTVTGNEDLTEVSIVDDLANLFNQKYDK